MPPPPRERLQRIARAAMIERGLEPDFSASALAEADRARTAPIPASAARDLRSLPWCSIDNDDSRDLDQLTVASPAAGGDTLIRIAVADVADVVARDSGVDRHAAHNTTSVYTDAVTFPMLRLRLSTVLTSLNPDEDRLAIVVEVRVDQNGAVADRNVYLAAVRNQAKLTYHEVGQWLKRQPP